jgi:hypothetical protein
MRNAHDPQNVPRLAWYCVQLCTSEPNAGHTVKPILLMRYQGLICLPKTLRAGLYHLVWVSSMNKVSAIMRALPPIINLRRPSGAASYRNYAKKKKKKNNGNLQYCVLQVREEMIKYTRKNSKYWDSEDGCTEHLCWACKKPDLVQIVHLEIMPARIP